jgi:threonine aldolase
VKTIDLRSDTVTRPTPAMREAMARAEVGDDVYGEDPNVNRLEEAAARRVGKEAAVFVPSGTMANQIGLRLHTHHGDVVLASEGAHVLRYEGGAASALSGVQIATIGRDGFFDAADVRAAFVPATNVHLAPTTLLAAENTHNSSGGRVVPFDRLAGAAEAAHEVGLRTHLDGARLLNAEVASGIPAARWAAPFDTVAFCFSKGLGAPVGSVLCGTGEAVLRARRLRKMLGGGMRQAGILAAAALFALENHVERLAVDHANARRLAEGMAKLGLAVDGVPQTNMAIFRLQASEALGFQRVTQRRDLLINPISPGRFRAVTHLDVSADDVEDALGRLEEAMAELRTARGSAP